MDALSGRFVLRLDPRLHGRLKARAEFEGISLNALCARLLSEGLEDASRSRGPEVPGLDPGLLDGVQREWRRDLVGIVLFGSAARGEAGEGSDLDLLLVLAAGVPIERALYDRWDRLIRARKRSEDGRVSPHFVSLDTSPEEAGGLWLEVAREGIVLRDREGRVARFLTALRDHIGTGAVVRKTVHGHPYWVREPGAR